MTDLCAWCNKPRTTGPTCPSCGADYEKAARIKSGIKPAPAQTQSESRVTSKPQDPDERFVQEWDAVEDPAFEHQLCLWVLPAMLGIALLMEIADVGSGMLRVVFGMPVHELGHAVAGWFSGFASIPTLWKTLVPESRGWIAPVILFAAIGYLLFTAQRKGNGTLLILGGALLFLQFIGTVALELKTAKMLVTWGGDGVGMMLAVALMAGFNFGKQTGWYKDYLRWGFVWIGAAAFADISTPWWASLDDISNVPYGLTGGNHTDTYKLMHYHGWEMNEVINRYVTVSVLCAIALVVFYIHGIRQAGKAVQLRQVSDKLAA